MNLSEQNPERLALAALCTQDGIWDWQLDTQSFFVSPRWQEMLGRHGDAPPACREQWLALVHPKDRRRLERDLDAALAAKVTQFEHEHRVQHASGGYRWVAIRAVIVRGNDGAALRVTGIQTDISDRKHLDALARTDSLYDPLTMLPGRRLFDRRLSRALERSQRHVDYSFAVLFVDLDRFKEINDNYGHLIGDCVLAEIARRLQACVRPGDMVARRGGDEFTVLVDDLNDLTDAIGVAERIQAQIEAPLELDQGKFSLSASVGIAASSQRYTRPEDMLHDADRSMYQAKLRARPGATCEHVAGQSYPAPGNEPFMVVEASPAQRRQRPR